jgi:transcriptional regulator PpsR
MRDTARRDPASANANLAAVRQFRTPKKTLGDLDAQAAASLIAAAADVALVIDAGGVVRDIALADDELALDGFEGWIGKPWVDTVTVESRAKVQSLLRDAAAHAPPRWRQINAVSIRGGDVPLLFSALQVGSRSRVVAVARDLRAVAALQQRLLDAQQAMERDYSRLRQAETRYRLLFQMAMEAVLIVDAATLKIVEANPVAAEQLGERARRPVGQSFAELFDARGGQSVRVMLERLRATGRADEVRARLADSKREFLVSASVFRQETGSLFLVRLAPVAGDIAATAVPKTKSRLVEVVESLPDGFIVTDLEGRVITANRAFVDMTQYATEEQLRGESLERWLGRPGIDLNVLMANLRQHGSVRLFATTLRGEYGSTSEVEISAVAVTEGETPCFGFTIRNVGRRLAADARAGRELPRSVEQLTELIGRVSLKDLVRETTDVIERLCIEAALELTGDNRASAAELLGLSRQSLYVKLRRYGLGDLDAEPEAASERE